MTTTPSDTQSRARLALSVLASSALLAAGAAAAPALMTSANAASPATTSHQRAVVDGHRVVHLDARRDVLLFDYESETSKPAPRNRATDIVKTVVDHRPGRLVVQTRVRELSRSDYHLMIAEILTPAGKRFELLVDFSTKPIGPRISLTPFNSVRDVRCPDATWSVNPSVDRIEASVPNSCLGDPGWVRVGLGVVASPRDLKTSWADDSRTTGRIAEEHLKLGPRQPRA